MYMTHQEQINMLYDHFGFNFKTKQVEWEEEMTTEIIVSEP
jgi:hypothetical protein